jgi:hypothetical protein
MAEEEFDGVDRRFLAAVRDQAAARKEMDFQGFLGYFDGAALARLRGTMEGLAGRRARIPRPGDIERFELLAATSDGDEGHSEVRYSGYGSFVLKQDWKRTEAGWRVTGMERPDDLATGPSLLQRLKRLPNSFSPVRMSRPPGRGPGMMGS